MQTESSPPQTRPGMLAGVFLAGIIIGVGTMAVLSGHLGGTPSPPPDTLPPPPTTLPMPTTTMCEGLVKLSVQGGSIVADPETVCLAVGRPLTWEIVDKGTVKITFVSNDGPFPEDTSLLNEDHTPINDKRGTYDIRPSSAAGSRRVKSRGADNLPGQWKYKYKIEWTTPTGDTLTSDPVVCIRR